MHPHEGLNHHNLASYQTAQQPKEQILFQGAGRDTNEEFRL